VGSIDIHTTIISNAEKGYPLIPDPELTTSIGTGTATITLGTLPDDRRKLRSSHVGASGSQTILYPENWEGVVSCQVQIGSCHMWGKDIEVIETRNNATGLDVYMKAVRGKLPYEKADTSIELRGGPVEVGIGKMEKIDVEKLEVQLGE
jgi:hypothetical protein